MEGSEFEFYEIVRVTSDNPTLAEIKGERGAILGIGADDDGTFSYSVFIYRDEICWDISEEELEATGEFSSRDAFYDGTSVSVNVDEEGRGQIED